VLHNAEGVMIDHALAFSSAEFPWCAVGGWVFDTRGAYALYVIGVIGPL
jgi:hypothetical protein